MWNRVWRWKTAQVLRNRIFRATRNKQRWASHRRRPPTARPATTTFISNRTALCHRKVQLVALHILKISKDPPLFTYRFLSQKSSQTQQPQLNSLGSYRSSQQVNRPSPQSSPGLTIQVSARKTLPTNVKNNPLFRIDRSQGSPLSYSNNPSAPPSPTGHPGPPNLTSESIDQNSYFMNQAQAAALQQDFEQFTMVSENALATIQRVRLDPRDPTSRE